MQNRRRFIKKSLLAVTGAGFFTGFDLADLDLNPQENRKFIYRTLGRTGITLPVISMGTNNTSDPALIKYALENGVKLTDVLRAAGMPYDT